MFKRWKEAAGHFKPAQRAPVYLTGRLYTARPVLSELLQPSRRLPHMHSSAGTSCPRQCILSLQKDKDRLCAVALCLTRGARPAGLPPPQSAQPVAVKTDSEWSGQRGFWLVADGVVTPWSPPWLGKVSWVYSRQVTFLVQGQGYLRKVTLGQEPGAAEPAPRGGPVLPPQGPKFW